MVAGSSPAGPTKLGEAMMEIEVISVDEETGRVELELDQEAQVWLINVGFNKILRDAIDSMGTNDERIGDESRT